MRDIDEAVRNIPYSGDDDEVATYDRAKLVAFSDSNWVEDRSNRKSTGAYIRLYKGGLV